MSSLTPKFIGKVENGHLTFDSPKSFANYLKSLTGPVEIIVAKVKIKRTIEQNRLYWLYLRLIAEETGDFENDLHDFLKRKFLPPVYKKVLGQDFKVPSSTTRLGKMDFSEYLSQIEKLTGVPIPDTSKIYGEDFDLSDIY